MATLKIPTITESDLHEFHQALFGMPFTGASTLSQLEAANETVLAQDTYADGDDDDLGYYADGIKRTLTDEQISMFRHSEIQQLLRDRRLARESAEGETQSSVGDDVFHDESDKVEDCEMKESEYEPAEAIEMEERRSKSEGGDQDDFDMGEEEKEYARFLKAERLEFQRAAAAKRNGERSIYDPDDRTISTRRRVREMDDVQANAPNVTLLYDDETPTVSSTTREMAQPAVSSQAIATSEEGTEKGTENKESVTKAAGRKFWWPEIRPQG